MSPTRPTSLGPGSCGKLLIDRRHQGNGYGRAVAHVAEIVRREGGPQLHTSHVAGEESPLPFYLGLGFRLTGEHDDNGEAIPVLDL